MVKVTADWNPMQSKLRELIQSKDNFGEMKELLFQMHALVHSSAVYQGKETTYMDEIWEGLDDMAFKKMPTVKDDTIAWNIWHITRIEDLTVNLLITKGNQVLDEEWHKRLGTAVKDTGNAMTDEEIIELSQTIHRESLYEYRNAVGQKTRQMIQDLRQEDLKRKVEKEGLNRILNEGGVTTHPDSIWLLDFWGRKNVAGIILMPVTRHQVVHINDCLRLKNICKKSE